MMDGMEATDMLKGNCVVTSREDGEVQDRVPPVWPVRDHFLDETKLLSLALRDSSTHKLHILFDVQIPT